MPTKSSHRHFLSYFLFCSILELYLLHPYWCIDIIKDYFLIKCRWHEGCTSQVVIGVKGYGYSSAISNNISVISWWSALLVEETRVLYPGKTTHMLQVTDKLYHIICIEYTSPWTGFELTLVVISTDCIGNCKSNYHTITIMTTPFNCLYIYIYIETSLNLGPGGSMS